MSTIAPSATDRFIAALQQRGIEMVDAPVGRSPQHAADGKLLIMVGATPNALERVRPILERMGDTIIHCGAPGMGSRMKIVNNFMSVTLNVTTAEALILAERSGLSPEIARSVMLGTTAGQGHMATTYPAKVLRGDTSPGFAIDLAYKDLLLALDLAREVGLDVPTADAARPVYEAVRKDGLGREDWTALYTYLRNDKKG
jgi:4-hydroxybutyrate dehydrogenase/sulfolactaldehyde 3-reductase